MENKIIIKTLVCGELATNCYLLYDNHTHEVIIIDPGDDAEYISTVINDLKLMPMMIIATHGHFDHVLAAWHLQNVYAIPFAINEKDIFLLKNMQQSAKYFLNHSISDQIPKVDKLLNNLDEILLGENKLKIITVPGHTPGSIAIYDQTHGNLIVGDVVFKDGGLGRTDFKYCDYKELIHSVNLILSYPSNTVIFSGHGEVTTIKNEKAWHKI